MFVQLSSIVVFMVSTGYTGSATQSYGSLHSEETLLKILSVGHGGYDCEFIDPPTAGLQTKCDICSLVLRSPHQTQCCGKIFCKSCIERVKKQKQLCPGCNEAVYSTFHDKKLERTINALKVRCIHEKKGCAWTGELVALDRHLNMNPECDKLLVGCEFMDINCEFSSAGCKARVPRKDMEIHRDEPHHIQLLAEAMKERDKRIDELTMELQRKDELLAQDQLQMVQDKQQIQELTSKLHKIKEEATYVGLQLGNQLPEESFRQIAELIRGNRELKLLLDTPTPRKPPAEPSQQVSPNHCLTMEKFEFHKTNDKVWYSKPFYTHEEGYKMCLRIYANGFDKECGTHLSLYTCFLIGEYDDKLQWPFYGKIAVELLDQSKDDTTKGRHHERIVNYDENIPDHYAQRVTVGRKAGPGWGRSQFIPHFKLDPEYDSTVQYLKDDCLKFRVRKVLLHT